MINYYYGIDLSNSILHVVKGNSRGKELARQKVDRRELGKFLDSIEKGSVLCMESCSGSHNVAKEAVRRGLEARLLPAQHTKRFRTKQKNDYNDAKAILTANFHEDVKAVPAKSFEELDLQVLHRRRERLIKQRTQIGNEARGYLRERGRIIAKGLASLRRYFTLELSKDPLISAQLKEVLADSANELRALEERITKINKLLGQHAKTNLASKKLLKVPGIGIVISTYAATHSTAAPQYKNGRAFAASKVGLIPRQNSTGDVVKLGRVTRNGDPYFRKILVQGARSIMRRSAKKKDPLSLWIQLLLRQKHSNVVAVAVANKLSRIIWRLLANNEDFNPTKTNGQLAKCVQTA